MGEMKKEIRRINHHGREVFGYLYLPGEEGVFPAVIFSHGYNGSGDDFMEYAAYLTGKGIVAFCYDFCGGEYKMSFRSDCGLYRMEHKKAGSPAFFYIRKCNKKYQFLNIPFILLRLR